MVSKLQLILRRKKESKSIYKEDLLTKIGREQLKKINERGLDLPVVLL